MYFTGRSVLRRKEEEGGELGQLQLNLNAIHEGWLVKCTNYILDVFYLVSLSAIRTFQSAVNSTWI